MTRLLTTSVLALGALVAVDSASAQSRFGVGAGYDFDSEAPLVSAQVRTGRMATVPIRLNPNLDVYFPGNSVTALQFNVNALYDFGIANASFTPYAGIGLGVGYIKAGGKSDTDPGANFVFGAEFNAPAMRPYLQLQVTTTNAAGAAIAAGLLF